ncbi:HD family phosphohydrolase [Tuwongella immobilis]|uniref:HD domain-containing protein n=1 Tax=Tuwongella immobilis TaxID=692036 RepID=A0A6C2YV48_9BACT|nr:HDIG domain-containing metalloprotein [Tuwongella immobilis]VIP04859.1 Putative domain HDIG-containing protein OS=Singulisphaera acidiphila (strain ATCC BAA-1392 / DSM 18658 / VKM B-2454 / MOB10) GN=Sinac_6812 PE=4 SV=1: 7TM-7TMR_HD: HD [Tuwongella immobilis]VTS07077.1 Putative domain HDIG-containing protein OS=Singulisphaera acidiphila (strain ATCC BAA-1392 / DSM 18658 / VKM B-2454 / MOB10) GN=Sinac_6812 PE=4 SV=1: 7TM-7TMR_HD: HD [Tuwongella immobilis]
MWSTTKKCPRLGQWNGRRHSSRSDTLSISELRKPDNLARLAVVLGSALVVTAMVFLFGPTMPYRVGEAYPYDLRVRVAFEVVNTARTAQLRTEIAEMQNGAIAEPVQAESPLIDHYKTGFVLVEREQPVTPEKFALLQAENRAYVASLPWTTHFSRAAALLLIVLLLTGVLVLYAVRFQKPLASSMSQVVGVCVIAITTVGCSLLLSPPPWQAMLVPLTVMAMVLTIAYNPPFALLISFSLALVINVTLGIRLVHFLVQMAGLATAVLMLRDLRTRTRPVEVGLIAGLAYLAMNTAAGILTQQSTNLILTDGCRYLIWGVLAGFILSGTIPWIERIFGIVTDVSLLELSDNSHPLLQELIKRAPGTYTHSMTVATLAESAADAIQANSLLVRVGCYYHDIGKMMKPHYFIENQNGKNRHDELEPALSTLVIIGHVKDGMALARQYNLPKPISDFIQQHHGTTLVEYFYREALRLQECSPQTAADLEFVFRYPGPKPQSREAGILMLADAVESASRALHLPTPSSIRKLVHDLMMKRLLDGQFDESNLTLTELAKIEESLCKSLIAVYHHRIKYPACDEPRSQAG